MRKNKPILLVEDDIVDRMTVERALGTINVTNPLATAQNGEEALAYLRGSDSGRPCLVLLDLNMPKMGGLEFLKEVKSDESLRSIPVVVLTTSCVDGDRRESFYLGAAGYMVKPVDYPEFVEIMRTIDSYWSKSEMAD